MWFFDCLNYYFFSLYFIYSPNDNIIRKSIAMNQRNYDLQPKLIHSNYNGMINGKVILTC